MDSPLKTIGQELDEARTKIEAARDAMLAILGRDIDAPEFRQAVGRLERIDAELERIEAGFSVREGLA
jgi:hypothetical protein